MHRAPLAPLAPLATPAPKPSEEEVLRYAVSELGLDVEREADLLWIAREGAGAPLTEGWTAQKDDSGEPYFFNERTGQTRWDHPSIERYRDLCEEHRRLRSSGGSAGRPTAPQRSASPPQQPFAALRGRISGDPSPTQSVASSSADSLAYLPRPQRSSSPATDPRHAALSGLGLGLGARRKAPSELAFSSSGSESTPVLARLEAEERLKSEMAREAEERFKSEMARRAAALEEAHEEQLEALRGRHAAAMSEAAAAHEAEAQRLRDGLERLKAVEAQQLEQREALEADLRLLRRECEEARSDRQQRRGYEQDLEDLRRSEEESRRYVRAAALLVAEAEKGDKREEKKGKGRRNKAQ